MDELINIKPYKDRIRILIILYVFGEPYNNAEKIKARKFFKSELRIQKIDFLLRNPDYLCYELLEKVKSNYNNKEEVKDIIKNVYDLKEPIIKKLEMERFLFGAYEDIDDVIAFLQSLGLIEFSSRKRSDLKNTIDKKYYVNELAINNFKKVKDNFPFIDWYIERCELIKKYFGDLNGTQLKISQYEIDEYKNTSFNDYIQSISERVREEFYNIYLEEL